jgi:flagellar basal body-associated protein FliL
MSSSEKPETPAPEPGASKMPLLIAALVALLLGVVLGFLVLPKFVGGGAHAEGEAAAATEGAEQPEGEEAEAGGESEAGESGAAGEGQGAPSGAFADRVVQLDPFVVNVSGEKYPRYLKLQVVFEMRSQEAKQKLEQRIAPVRDLTISLLSSRRLADITDFEGKALLKDDLRHQVDELLGKDSVESVLFTEFVVQ